MAAGDTILTGTLIERMPAIAAEWRTRRAHERERKRERDPAGRREDAVDVLGSS